MLEYLYLICLLSLTVSVPILIRGCFNIHKELPNQGGDISTRIDKVAELLDEMADLISNAVQIGEDTLPAAQMTNSPLMSALNLFMSKAASPPEHGKTQSQEWEVLPPNEETQ